jgi:hypothetical protein
MSTLLQSALYLLLWQGAQLRQILQDVKKKENVFIRFFIEDLKKKVKNRPTHKKTTSTFSLFCS